LSQHTGKTTAAPSTNANAMLTLVHADPTQFVPRVKNFELSTQVPAARSSNASVLHLLAPPPPLLALLQVTSSLLSIPALAVQLTNALATRLNVQLSSDHHVTLVNNASSSTTKPVASNTPVSAINKSVHNHQSAPPDTNLKPAPEPAAMPTNASATTLPVHPPLFQNVQPLLV
jgi:hypothetical protein